jgi:hypothetical protein
MFQQLTQFERINMKILITALVSAFMLVSTAAFAGSHGGGKMDDKKDEKKVDCSKKENEKAKECEKKK